MCVLMNYGCPLQECTMSTATKKIDLTELAFSLVAFKDISDC